MQKILNVWINEFVTRWKNKDIDSVIKLFSNICLYYETPFSNVVSKVDDIKNLWLDIIFQDDIVLDIDVLMEDNNNAILHWYLKYKDARDLNIYEMDGIYQIELDNEGHCTFFKQWWVMNE